MTTLTIDSGLGYAWPEEITGATEVEHELVANVRGSSSQFDGSSQTVEVPGARYALTLRWNVLAGEEANAMLALVHQMRGGAKKILVPWFPRLEPLGTQRGAPTVNASGTGGSVLALNNCTIGGTFKRGDMWELETGQVVCVAEDATAYAASVILRVAVPIRTIPPNGSVAAWDGPRLLMISSNARNKVPAMSGNQVKNVELQFVEVFG